MNKVMFRKKLLRILKSDKTAKEIKKEMMKLKKKHRKEYVSFADDYVEALKKNAPEEVKKNDAYWMWFQYNYFDIY